MAEEFQESEVIFSNHEHQERSYFRYGEMGVFSHEGQRVLCTNKRKKGKKNTKKAVTAAAAAKPMNIPISNVLQQFGEFNDQFDELEEECDELEGELVPPHVILGRRIAGKMQFSVCTGNGRTLKGRDLSQVRNSILRMTGFLET